MAKTMTTQTAEISLTADEGYARAAARLEELRAQARVLEAGRTELSEGLGREVSRRDLLTHRAERLLNDDVVPMALDVERDAMRRSLGGVEDELGVVRRAIELQQAAVERERRRVSALICDRVRPQYRANVQAIARALTDLVDALTAEQTFRQQLIDADVLFASDLRPMPLPALGLFNDPNAPDSAAALWLREARQYGLLDADRRTR
jgi:hypothetical protein